MQDWWTAHMDDSGTGTSIPLQIQPEHNKVRDFPGGPVAKTPYSQCRGPEFDPWSGNKITHATDKDPACCS